METPTRCLLESLLHATVKSEVDTGINKKLLGIAWDMWQHCNEVLHKNQENRPQILEMETNSKVIALFDLGPSAFTNSNSLFKHPLP